MLIPTPYLMSCTLFILFISVFHAVPIVHIWNTPPIHSQLQLLLLLLLLFLFLFVLLPALSPPLYSSLPFFHSSPPSFPLPPFLLLPLLLFLLFLFLLLFFFFMLKIIEANIISCLLYTRIYFNLLIFRTIL